MSSHQVSSPARYRFEDRGLFIVVPSLVPALIVALLLQHYHATPTGWLAVVCVFLFNLPFLAWIAIIVLYFKEEKDDFQTQMLSRAMLLGIGATMVVTMLWGAMEQFNLVPIMRVRVVMPLFVGFYVVALKALLWRYR